MSNAECEHGCVLWNGTGNTGCQKWIDFILKMTDEDFKAWEMKLYGDLNQLR